MNNPNSDFTIKILKTRLYMSYASTITGLIAAINFWSLMIYCLFAPIKSNKWYATHIASPFLVFLINRLLISLTFTLVPSKAFILNAIENKSWDFLIDNLFWHLPPRLNNQKWSHKELLEPDFIPLTTLCGKTKFYSPIFISKALGLNYEGVFSRFNTPTVKFVCHLYSKLPVEIVLRILRESGMEQILVKDMILMPSSSSFNAHDLDNILRTLPAQSHWLLGMSQKLKDYHHMQVMNGRECMYISEINLQYIIKHYIRFLCAKKYTIVDPEDFKTARAAKQIIAKESSNPLTQPLLSQYRNAQNNAANGFVEQHWDEENPRPRHQSLSNYLG